MARLAGLVGLVAIICCAYLFSSQRSAIQKRVLLWGIVLQFGFAFLVLKTKFGELFYAISLFVNAVLNDTAAGSSFVFGDKLGLKNDQFGVIFAFQVLPIIIFIASAIRNSLLPGYHANLREGHGNHHAALHGGERC